MSGTGTALEIVCRRQRKLRKVGTLEKKREEKKDRIRKDPMAETPSVRWGRHCAQSREEMHE